MGIDFGRRVGEGGREERVENVTVQVSVRTGTENPKLSQPAKRVGRDGPNEANTREAKKVDVGMVVVAFDFDLGAGRNRRVPLDPVRMWSLGQKRKEALLVLNRLRVDSLATQ
ncbi:hypothetical protein ACFX2J_007329 [Malus domestica]